MSFRARVERHTDNHYVLPRVGSTRTDVHAFLSPALLAYASGEVFYEISHNLVQQETLVLPDGSAKRGFVHRKGATRAFPAGHPDLDSTVWQTTGHPCLVPGSMYQGDQRHGLARTLPPIPY